MTVRDLRAVLDENGPRAALRAALEAHAREAPDAPAVDAADLTLDNAGLAAAVIEAADALPRDERPALLPVTTTGADVVRLLAHVLAADGFLVLPATRTEFEQKSDRALRDDPRLREVPVEAPWLGLLTSGTTGRPRLVMRSLRSVLANAIRFAECAGYATGDRVLVGSPVHHAYALGGGILAAVCAGVPLLLEPLPLAPARLERRMADGATVLLAVPATYRRLVAAWPGGRKLRLAVSAGDRIDPDTARAVAGMADVVSNHYGTTESGSLTFDPVGRPETVGLAMGAPPVRVAAPPGEEGELVIDFPPGGTVRITGDLVEVLSEYRTGDLGRDDDGWITISGRISELANLAGTKIDVREIEAVLDRHPDVAESRVAVVTPEGQEPLIEAYVVTSADVPTPVLRRHVASFLSPIKVPTRYHVVDHIPRTATGKIIRA